MHILLINQERPLEAAETATGNAIRTEQLRWGLEQAGHRVSQIWLDQHRRDPQNHSFSHPDELRDQLSRRQPDAVLVTYWELLELLPFGLDVPVVLDFIAPRPLEQLFETPELMEKDLLRLRICLGKADCFMVGTDRQEHLLVPWLIQAGHDLRRKPSILRVPISAWGDPPERESTPAGRPWVLVTGGVNWPWRNAEPYWQALRSLEDRSRYRLNILGGTYKLAGGTDRSQAAPERDDELIRHYPLQTYQAFQDMLRSGADIGLELAEANIERYYSQSFRSLEFLRHGLPLIINDYLSLAPLVRQYDAGWTVSGPDQFARLLADMPESTEAWREKSANALRLVLERLHISQTIAPLLDYLAAPTKSRQLNSMAVAAPEHVQAVPKLAVPNLRQRIRRQLLLMRQALFARLRKGDHGGHVVIVTRDDLFPTDHGAAVKVVETARGLSLAGRTVAIVTDHRKRYWLFENGRRREQRFPWWLRLLALPRPLVKLLHMSKDIPLSNSFLYLPLSDRSFAWRTLWVARKIKAGVYQAEFPAYLRPAIWGRSVFGGKAILVEHNVEYERLRQQVPELTDSQYQNLKAIEIGLANQADAVICVSDNDRQRLAQDGVHSELLYTIPHGVDLEGLESAVPAGVRQTCQWPKECCVLVYHGTFDYEPNKNAIGIFADELIPRLEAAGLDVRVLAVGRNPPVNSPHPKIHFTGSVESVGPWLKAADIAVVPLIDGGGTRMKIIDYFAAGVPVVSTRKGIEGIPAVNGRHALIEDDWQSMASAIAALARDHSQRDALVRAAGDYVGTLDWRALAHDYIRVYGKAQSLITL